MSGLGFIFISSFTHFLIVHHIACGYKSCVFSTVTLSDPLSVCKNIQRIFLVFFVFFLIVPVIAASLAQRLSLSELLPNAPQRPENMEIFQRVVCKHVCG